MAGGHEWDTTEERAVCTTHVGDLPTRGKVSLNAEFKDLMCEEPMLRLKTMSF